MHWWGCHDMQVWRSKSIAERARLRAHYIESKAREAYEAAHKPVDDKPGTSTLGDHFHAMFGDGSPRRKPAPGA